MDARHDMLDERVTRVGTCRKVAPAFGDLAAAR